MPTYALIVYGCQMNDYDGEKVAAVMESAGYREAPEDEADVVFVYTCAVRKSATDRALGRITDLARVMKRNPAAVVAVGGCWPALEGEVVKAACPHVNFTFGTERLEELPALVATARGETAPAARADLSPRRRRWPRANVSIMTGCDNYCSYCVVPYARGRERCRPAADVLREVEELVTAGFKDITLIGQNVNSYRDGGVSFAELLNRADVLCDGVFLRFTTNHPRDFGADVAAVLAEGRNLARHVHLPLQSGSDAVLETMNRGYDMARYDEVVQMIRAAVPGVSLTTDLLVAFPGETDEDFVATLAAVERIRFDAAYTFMYSARPGTAAAARAETLDRPAKVRRLEAVAGRQREISYEINEKMVGEEKRVLVEGPSAKKAGEYAGRMSENKVVNFPGKCRPGDWVRVKITGASAWTLRGEPAPDGSAP